jgi:uncharacterized SAM-dependent methyltransferase
MFSNINKSKKAEYEKRNWVHTACRKKKRQVINQHLTATEKEFKKRTPFRHTKWV